MKRGKMMNLYADTGPFCPVPLNSLRPRLNRRPFADDIFKCIFLNENEWISPRISLKFVPKVRINNIPSLVQIMAWRRSGGKPLSEPMMVSLLTHICVTRPQWINQTTHLWKNIINRNPGHLVCLDDQILKLISVIHSFDRWSPSKEMVEKMPVKLRELIFYNSS